MSPYAFEPELDQPTPRRVAAREGCGYGCALWAVRLFILPHTLAGPFLMYQAVRAVVLYVGLLLAGTEVPGRVTATAERPGKKGPSYTADYVFTADGVEYAGHTQLTADEYAGVRKGQPIRVRVWGVAPQSAHSWDGSEGGSLQGVGAMCFAALFWNGVLSVFLWHLYVRPWRQCQLVRYGRPTAGVVREVVPAKDGKAAAVRIRYTYTPGPSDLFAGHLSGTVKVSPAERAADVKAGDTLTVLYDPKRPRRSLLYRFADHKAVGPATTWPPASGRASRTFDR